MKRPRLSGLVFCLGLAGLLALASGARAGAIAAWGNNNYGQVSNAPTGTDFAALAGGYGTGYALRANGSIVAWGNNNYSQVSNAPTGTGFIAIAAGNYTGYALRADGSIVAWGDNASSQVSNAPTGTGFAAIAGGYTTGYALVPLPSAAWAGPSLLGVLSGAAALRRKGRKS